MLLREVYYARPGTVEEAIALLAEHDGARALAGGQTLVNVMKQRAASPDVLVDLGSLDELRTISVSGSSLEIGAMMTLTTLIRSSEVEVTRPILAEVAATVADVQVRNRGTIGGNVCVNDPTNHFPPLLVALDATMTVAGVDGERTVSAEEFFVGVFETSVREGELLTRITVPPAARAAATACPASRSAPTARTSRTRRPPSSTATWRIALGCVAAVPVRATAIEARARRAASTRRPCARPSRGSARPSTRPPTSMRRPTTDAASRRRRSSAQSCRQHERAKG